MIKYQHHAMATQFEFHVAGEDETITRQACAAAGREIDRLENELSRFQSTSDIAAISRLLPGESYVLGLDAFACLKLAQEVAAETNGAFDVTLGSWRALHLDEDRVAVSVDVAGLKIDLGAIGKGYALDRVAESLMEWGIERALLNAGDSTVLAMGDEAWPVSMGKERVELRRQALSGSGIAQQGLHIVDPRTGQPVQGRAYAWALADTAARADALSTAFFVMSEKEIEEYRARHPEVRAVIEMRAAG